MDPSDSCLATQKLVGRTYSGDFCCAVLPLERTIAALRRAHWGSRYCSASRSAGWNDALGCGTNARTARTTRGNRGGRPKLGKHAYPTLRVPSSTCMRPDATQVADSTRPLPAGLAHAPLRPTRPGSPHATFSMPLPALILCCAQHLPSRMILGSERGWRPFAF